MDEQKEIRNDRGQLVTGHGGLKKPGSTNKLSREIKASLAEFLHGILGKTELEGLYSKLSDKEKSRFITGLLPFLIPKQKEIELSGEVQAGVRFKTDLTALSTEELKIFLKAQQIVQPNEGSDE
jgi:hypothetical protein